MDYFPSLLVYSKHPHVYQLTTSKLTKLIIFFYFYCYIYVKICKLVSVRKTLFLYLAVNRFYKYE